MNVPGEVYRHELSSDLNPGFCQLRLLVIFNMKTLRWPISLFVLFLILPALSASANKSTNLEAPHRRKIFYAGGQYKLSGTGPNHVLVDQLYVEQLTPLGEKQQPYPLVFYHGGGISGTVSTSV